MAYNPYGVIQSSVNLAEHQQKAKQQGIETREGTFKQKTKMKDELNKTTNSDGKLIVEPLKEN